MRGTACVAGVIAAILALGSMGFAQGQTNRGGPPRPAEKPPEYGCSFRDLATIPNVVPDGTRIDLLLLTYRCPEKTRPVDIEIQNERRPGVPPELVKVASRVVLERGEHTLRLAGGGLARGGRYIAELKASAPEGKRVIHRRVDTAVCRGWRIEDLEDMSRPQHAGDCDVELQTAPGVFKTGERIDRFILNTSCEVRHKNADIKLSWQPRYGENSDARREVVNVTTDAVIPAGTSKVNLMGGGVGREGRYVLEIGGITPGLHFKTACTAWALSGR